MRQETILNPRSVDPAKILKKLKQEYRGATCELDFETPFQLLVATVLSAQCTDVRVNLVTPALFARFPDAKSMSKAPVGNLEQMIRSTGFFRAKALALHSLSCDIMNKYNGQVPREMDALRSLRGVGRKTANVVLGNAFGMNSGIVVDTHVARISKRLGFTKHKDPVKIEKDLMNVVQKKDWIGFSHWMIRHGRSICSARKPNCSECFLKRECSFFHQHGLVPKPAKSRTLVKRVAAS